MGKSDQIPSNRPDCWLQGIWASVPTPFQANGALDLGGLAANVRHYVDALGLAGIYCNGIMGEGWSLTLEERMEVVEETISAAEGGLKVGVVATGGSLKETIRMSQHAEQIGIDHIIISPPPGQYNATQILRYVQRVRESTSVPIIIVEASSGGFGLPLIRFLASHPDCISAIKVAGTREDITHLVRECGEHLVVTDPYEGHWLSNLIDFGMHALYADPEPYLFQTVQSQPIQSYYRAYLANDHDIAWSIHSQLNPLRAVYDRFIMEPLCAGNIPVAALKAWCEYLGLAAGPPREPVEPLGPDLRRELHLALKYAGI